MSIAATLNECSARLRAEALAQFQRIAELYASGDELPPMEVLSALEASGMSVDDLEEAIDQSKQRLAAEAQARVDAEEAQRQAVRDERNRLAELVLTEPTIREQIASTEEKIRAAATKRDGEIAKLQARIDACKQKHGETIAALRAQSAQLHSRIVGELADARLELVRTADSVLVSQQHELRVKRQAILQRIDAELEQLANAQQFLDEVLRSVGGGRDASIRRRGEDIQQRRDVIAALRAKLADVDADLLTIEARKLLADSSDTPPAWLLDSMEQSK